MSNLAHPDANRTGVDNLLGSGIVAKQIELLRRLLPGAARFAVMTNLSNPAFVGGLSQLHQDAATLGVALDVVDVRVESDVDDALTSVHTSGAAGLVVGPDNSYLGYARHIVAQAAVEMLPACTAITCSPLRAASHTTGPGPGGIFSRIAYFVDRLLHGARAADLPVEQPTTIAFTLNQTAIGGLGLTVPDSVASEVTEWLS